MRILYGVPGEGMGHATRSRVILEHLLQKGHTVTVVVSGRAHAFLRDRFQNRPEIAIEEIGGFNLSYQGDGLDLSETILSNIEKGPERLVQNISQYFRLTRQELRDPEAVVSDFESWAYLFGLNHFLPVISLDNMQVINRCRHEIDVTDLESGAFRLAKWVVKLKVPGAYHYLVTSFFFPPIRKARTTLVPPILRPEILAARREPGKHILVYQTAATNERLLPTLLKLPGEFRVYGLNKSGEQGNVRLCPFSEKGFVDDLRTARAVIAGGGFSLMSEVVHLGLPMLSYPVLGQYEQELNARYLEKQGYGACTETLEPDHVAHFLENTDRYERALSAYPRQDNSMTFGLLDELLERIARGEGRPGRLESPAMGKFEGD